MVVKPAPTFQHPYLFLIGGRALPSNDVEPVGVLIIKQGFKLDGTPLSMPSPPSPESPLQILMKDIGFPNSEKPAKGQGESDEDYKNRLLITKYPSDLAIQKPNVDLVSIRNNASKNIQFGDVIINPNNNQRGPFRIVYGWREGAESPRQEKTGDSANFTPVAINAPFNPPPLKQRLKLPDGFDMQFFNSAWIIDGAGNPIEVGTGAPLRSGDVVRYRWPISPPIFSVSVTIPAQPTLHFTLNGESFPQPVFRSGGVDTVILDWNGDLSQTRFLIVWRFVFVWETSMELATLEVS